MPAVLPRRFARASHLRGPLLAIALLFVLAVPAISRAQELAHRLILKDGSYQLVTKYEVKGDRVRYMSAERDDWEEIPVSLVDWPATEKYERDRAGGSVPEAAELDKELEQENELKEAQLPEVAPRLRLPEDSGVFLLDNFQGEPQVVEIQQTAADVNRNTKANIFRGSLNPVAGLKVTIELDGAHAAIQSHVEIPSIYINIDNAPDRPGSAKDLNASPQGPQQPQQPQQPAVPYDRFRIVRAEVKSGKRIVGDVKRNAGGKMSQDQHAVKTTISRVTGGWLKITPTENLPSGEYALVELTGQEDVLGKPGMNLYVWDFGVNPKAPANANPWKPDAPKPRPEPAKKEN